VCSSDLTMGSNGNLQWANGTDVVLTLYVNNGDPENLQAGNLVLNDLLSLGFVVNMIPRGTGDLIGASYQNANGIWGAMILDESTSAMYGDPYFSALPAASIVSPFAAYPTWDGPKGSAAENNYRANVTALEASTVPSQQQKYLNNIQLLNAQNLPELVISYPPALLGYNARHWTGWSDNLVAYVPWQFNFQFLATLTPVGQTTSTSVTTTPATSTSATSSVQTSTSATSSSTTSGSDLTTLALGAVVVVVIVVIGAAYFMRRRRKP
jgi:hypothetical protein